MEQFLKMRLGELGLQLPDASLEISQLRSWIGRRLESARLEVTTCSVERTVIPDRQLTSDLERVHRLFECGRKLVRRSIAFGAQRMEQLANGGIEINLPMDRVQQITLGRAVIETNAQSHGYRSRHGLAKLAELQERRVRVKGEQTLGG